MRKNLNRFYSMCGTVHINARQKTIRNTHFKFYKYMVVPVLTYTFENWEFSRRDKTRIE